MIVGQTTHSASPAARNKSATNKRPEIHAGVVKLSFCSQSSLCNNVTMQARQAQTVLAAGSRRNRVASLRAGVQAPKSFSTNLSQVP